MRFIALVNARPVLLFSGNPGFPAFYVPFAKALYSSVNRRFPVWIISHAGHALAPKDKKILAASDGMSLSTCDREGVFVFLESPLRLRVTPVPVALGPGCHILVILGFLESLPLFYR